MSFNLFASSIVQAQVDCLANSQLNLSSAIEWITQSFNDLVVSAESKNFQVHHTQSIVRFLSKSILSNIAFSLSSNSYQLIFFTKIPYSLSVIHKLSEISFLIIAELLLIHSSILFVYHLE